MTELTVSRKYPPGDLAIWIFIIAELLVFGIFFATYAFTRANNVELFNTYQLTLDRDSALINTLVLITSSYFVVRSILSVKENNHQTCVRWLLAAMGMGLLFIVIKSSEFAHHLSAGVSLSSNAFYMFYLSLTFFHFLHVILGMVILTTLAYNAHRGRYNDNNLHGIESGASYWHMVDLVWLILFPLVYVMR